jgi:hypothetical protein
VKRGGCDVGACPVRDADLGASIIAELRRRDQTLASAESLTGGMVGASLTDIPGSSGKLCGWCDHLRHALKATLAGVKGSTLAELGPVAGDTAGEMAHGVGSQVWGRLGMWRQRGWLDLSLRMAIRSARSSSPSATKGATSYVSRSLPCKATARKFDAKQSRLRSDCLLTHWTKPKGLRVKTRRTVSARFSSLRRRAIRGACWCCQ